jgi:hypothetical protein
MSHSNAEHRARPTRDRVSAAAVALADKLGVELGVEAMSLYNHVAYENDLLDGRRITHRRRGLRRDRPAGRRNRLAQRDAPPGAVARATLTRHRWAIELMESRTTPAPRRCATTTP